jgi:hypothetical protein
MCEASTHTICKKAKEKTNLAGACGDGVTLGTKYSRSTCTFCVAELMAKGRLRNQDNPE